MNDNEMIGAFGMLINALEGDGDVGKSFPASDANDMRQGARFIPGKVTLERRAGKKVQFVMNCPSNCCWYWQIEDGTRIYHWDRETYFDIGQHNNGPDWNMDSGTPAGPCHICGNAHTTGATIEPTPPQ